MEKVVLDGKNLTLEQVYKVVYEDAKVEIAPAAMERARKAKKVLYKMVEDETPVYGTNRGVGWNKDRKVYSEYFDQYNKNLLRSHSLCVPPYCTEEEKAFAKLQDSIHCLTIPREILYQKLRN